MSSELCWVIMVGTVCSTISYIAWLEYTKRPKP